MVKILCKTCSHLWDYKGKSVYYATCSRCKNQNNIKNCVVKENVPAN